MTCRSKKKMYNYEKSKSKSSEEKRIQPVRVENDKTRNGWRNQVLYQSDKTKPKRRVRSTKARGLEGSRYAMNGRVSFSPDVPRYSAQTVYYYEVGASDGSYRKCLTRDEADRLFEVLIEFEKRQTEIR